MADLKKALQQLRGARDSLIAEINVLDGQIAERHARRAQLTTGPVSKVDFLRYVKADMDRRATYFERALMRALAAAPKDYGSLQRIHSTGAKLNVHYLTGDQSPADMTEGAIYFYFGADMIARLNGALDALDWPQVVATADERGRLIAGLDTEIEDLNRQRDDLAATLIDAGLAC